MRNTYQIRKYLTLAAALTISAGLLIGCSKSDSSTQDSSAATGNTGINASGNVVAGAGSSNTEKAKETSADNTAENKVQQETQNTGTQPQSPAGTGNTQNVQNVSGTTTQTPQQQTDAQASTVRPSGNKQSQDTADEDDEDDGQEDFTGEFVKNDDEEAVKITLENDHLLTFVFRTSQISGSAKRNGNTAVYDGDDGHTITFESAGDILIVTVDGEGTGRTVMDGIYYRDLGEDDTEDEEGGTYDADETEPDDETEPEDEDEDEI